MYWLSCVVLSAMIGLIAPSRVLAAQAPEQCPPAAPYDVPAEPLDQFAAAIKSGKPVNILVLGSSSSAVGGQGGYIPQMLSVLQAALPRVSFRLTVRAHRGMTAEEMLAALKQALAEGHYPLVLWQTGTVEAVESMRPEDFAAALGEGAELVTSQGGNLVLIDQQFSRFLRANTDLTPYAQAMAAAAAMPGADLFQRYALMHAWVDDHAIDIERTPPTEEPAARARLHHCLGVALAKFLLNGIGR